MMATKKLFQLFVLPFILYIIPLSKVKFIPKITDLDVYFSIWAIIFIIYFIVLFKNWKLLTTTKKKILTTIILTAFFVIHTYALLLINLTHHSKMFSKEIIQTKITSVEPTIYILENVGIFNSHDGAEIGYSPWFSLFYSRYYRTKNHLKLLKEDSNQILIQEYVYERPASNKKIIVPSSELIKREIRIIKIIPSKLK
ncbi:hypothetical protein [Cytophaga aurantiaca]|uniref:hypothetical protein n=1 Tax=Cytophaga aurantiaca TaxID=29530 RepID=UPI0003A0E980|nr:hypothetical protein [Cytophaga aurantiaca]